MQRLLRDFAAVVGRAIRGDIPVQRPLSTARGASHAQGTVAECCLALQANLRDVHGTLDGSGLTEAEDAGMQDDSLNES